MKTVFLLSTEGCHLCEDAMALCHSINVSPTPIDIVTDDALVELYGDKIPVLIAEEAEQALFWPFQTEQIKEYLKFYGIS